jgi:uncharacterized protein (TIGR03790 family)
MRESLLVLLFLGLGNAMATAASAPDDLAARTVILVNSNQAESMALGEFYAGARGIPLANLIALPMPAGETITWRIFVDQVWQPLQDELLRRSWLEGITGNTLDPLGRKRVAVAEQRVAFLVVCRGTPLRIAHDPTLLDDERAARFPDPLRTNQGAVDSELSLLAVGNYEVTAFVGNPFFDGERPPAPDARLVIKVARLDAPSLADARGLVTSGLAAERAGPLGRAYVDMGGPHPDGDRWLESTRRKLDEAGFECDVDRTAGLFSPAVRFDEPVFYFGWYAENLTGPFERESFRFPPGAVALHIHSRSAQTLRSATEGWCGPLLARGVAATFGNVFEPYLQYTHRPDVLVTALLRGENLGDAAYAALPVLSWQAVVIGDPLYRPFKIPIADQRGRQVQLPSELAPYAVMRESRLLFREGKVAEADRRLEAGFRQFNSLALALTRARLDLERHDAPAGIAALEYLAASGEFRAEDWPLVREAAQFLAHNGAPAAALGVYARLATTVAPTPAAQRALLVDARTLAESAGDTARVREFARLLEELSKRPE